MFPHSYNKKLEYFRQNFLVYQQTKKEAKNIFFQYLKTCNKKYFGENELKNTTGSNIFLVGESSSKLIHSFIHTFIH